MRKLTAGLFISLDGVTESPDQWQFDVFDDTMGQEIGAAFAEQDALLMGRVLYQEWSEYWPRSTDEPFATMINTIPKYVASTTLDDVAWGDYDNVTLLKGDLAERLAELKAQPGLNIGMSGSSALIRWLIQNDLLDELTLMIHPVVVGKGRRLWGDDDALKRLQLADSKTTSTGVVILKYVPKKDG
jgi:dihydrofolate reductase